MRRQGRRGEGKETTGGWGKRRSKAVRMTGRSKHTGERAKRWEEASAGGGKEEERRRRD